MIAPLLAVTALVAGLLAPAPTTAALDPSEEPRLLIDAAGLDAIRARIAAGGVPGASWASLARKADAYTDPASPSYADPLLVNPDPETFPDWAVYDSAVGQNEYGTILTDLGLAYAISRDPRYGRHAVELLLAIERTGWRAWNGNQLGQGGLSKGVALAYDWVRDLLTGPEREVLVNGHPQTQYHLGGLAAHETIVEYAHAGSTTLVDSDLRTAYVPVSEIESVPWAQRALSFSAAPGEPVLLAVTDTLNRDGQAHGYQWRLHTDAAHAVTLADQSFTVVAMNGATMAGAVAEADGRRTLWAFPFRQPALFSLPAAKMVIQSDNDGFSQKTSLDHLAVMAVTPPGSLPATVTPVPAEGGSAIRVDWSGVETLFASRARDTGMVTTGRLSTDAAFVKLTPSGAELALQRGTRLALDDDVVVEVIGSPATVVLSGGEIAVTGDEGKVTVDGTPVEWRRMGGHVAFCAGHCPNVVGMISSSTARAR